MPKAATVCRTLATLWHPCRSSVTGHMLAPSPLCVTGHGSRSTVNSLMSSWSVDGCLVGFGVLIPNGFRLVVVVCRASASLATPPWLVVVICRASASLLKRMAGARQTASKLVMVWCLVASPHPSSMQTRSGGWNSSLVGLQTSIHRKKSSVGRLHEVRTCSECVGQRWAALQV